MWNNLVSTHVVQWQGMSWNALIHGDACHLGEVAEDGVPTVPAAAKQFTQPLEDSTCFGGL